MNYYLSLVRVSLSRIILASALAAGILLPGFAFADTGAYAWTDQTAAGSRNWSSITSSSDGTKLVAAIYGGDIYTSVDSGATWTDQTAAGSRNWYTVTSSSNGTNLAAVAYGGDIYTSADSGATWTDQTAAGSHNWRPITSSSNGTKLVAAVYGGDIYTSTTTGATWTDQTGAGSHNWYAITSSSDGTKLAAVVFGGDIYTSTDSGGTWTNQTGAGSGNWKAITSSSDGTNLAAAVQGGDIYTSTDSGGTWTDQAAAGSRDWRSITSSSDGTTLAAVSYNGDIYTSTDSGATWTDETGAGLRNWYAVTSSSDGTNLAAAIYGGDIYTAVLDSTAPTVDGDLVVSNLAQTSLTLSWTKATDDTSAQSALQYRVYQSTSDNMNTVSDAQTNGTALDDWTTDINTLDITSLSADTDYYFAILVKDEAGNIARYGVATVTTPAPEAEHSSSHHSGGGSVQTQAANLAANGNTAAADALKAQWPNLFGSAAASTGGASSVLTGRDLELGMTGDDVLALQKLLNANGFVLAATGLGSAGNETTYFGSLTRTALAAYQKAHGITPAAGYFGSITRAQMKAAGLVGIWW